MNSSQLFAWIGTGLCDPHKNLKQSLITFGVVLGWMGVIYALYRLSKSKRSKPTKLSIIVIVLLLAAIATAVVYVYTVIAFACARYS